MTDPNESIEAMREDDADRGDVVSACCGAVVLVRTDFFGSWERRFCSKCKRNCETMRKEDEVKP